MALGLVCYKPTTKMTSDLSRTIVFITGTFIGNNCWDEWIPYFGREGYKCIAPAWPYKEASAEELRNKSANDPIASNTLTSLTDYLASIIKSLPEKPILIGHSFGGLVVQLLLQQGN
jgi:pimeloyl-ACP methyl ester carboxylesterase